MNSVIHIDALVVGSGAAGFSAACRIAQEGRKSVAIITEDVLGGTSRNTGSDKQTYYKLGLGGSAPDSVRNMAQNLFDGGAVDGDNALCEAALSTRCFLNLCELGVAFPQNRYGEYIGYKTDHDPYARATSVGPLTSKFMTEALEKQARALSIPIYSDMYAVELLTDADGICGLLCLNMEDGSFTAFHVSDIVLATGGPAGIYADSVYPKCHFGASSLAFRAGAAFQNMTEWQYGLASTEPRWNVSGTYMQVLPRFISVDEQGNEREFLLDFFDDPYDALSAVFMKGYQWPFDSAKVLSGSSVIDLLVYRECALKDRKVFLDYRENPFGLSQIDYERLSPESYNYLKNANACFGTPIERLLSMNAPAVELYRSKGVDLLTQRLPIALCAQHNNGGISVDLWWQTTVPGLFAAGECAGTHGISRPGGSALNAGQVGALRAAQYLSHSGRSRSDDAAFEIKLPRLLEKAAAFAENILSHEDNAVQRIQSAQRRMSVSGGAIRQCDRMRDALSQVRWELETLEESVGVASRQELYLAFRLRDILTCQLVCLESMLDFASSAKATRGSALYTAPEGEKREGLEELFRFVCSPRVLAHQVQQGLLLENTCRFTWRDVRPIPEEIGVFETVWRRYREDRNIY